MAAESPTPGSEPVVFATGPGLELIRYPDWSKWYVRSTDSGKEARVKPADAWQIAVARDAQVVYGNEGGTRFYAQVHKSQSSDYDWRHEMTVAALLPEGVTWKLLSDETPEILRDFRAKAAATREARDVLAVRERAASEAWYLAVDTVAALPEFQGKALYVPQTWPCLRSPLRTCLYDQNSDQYSDEGVWECLVCGAPHERESD